MGLNTVFKTGPNPPVGFENSGKNVDRAERKRRRRGEGKRSGILAVGFWFFFLIDFTLF